MTTDHLPECPVPEMDGLWGLPMHPEDAKANCICGLLRACEQRVRARYSAYLNADNEGSYAAGFRDAMQAAREAVAALANKIEHPWASIGDALAAIDELRNPPSLPPTKGRAHKY